MSNVSINKLLSYILFTLLTISHNGFVSLLVQHEFTCNVLFCPFIHLFQFWCFMRFRQVHFYFILARYLHAFRSSIGSMNFHSAHNTQQQQQQNTKTHQSQNTASVTHHILPMVGTYRRMAFSGICYIRK